MANYKRIGIFKVCKVTEFFGPKEIKEFEVQDRIFFSYERAWNYVHEAFKRNNVPMPFREEWSFVYDSKDNGSETLINEVLILSILPFYIQKREWP